MWIESHLELGDHPKKQVLCALLFEGSLPADAADYATIGLVHRLWWWTLTYTKDGDLTPFSDELVARGCRWAGDPATLVAALKRAGFIDEDGHVHEWHDYAGKLLERRAANAERMRKARAQHVHNTCTTRANTSARTCEATRPDQTEPTEGEDPSPPLAVEHTTCTDVVVLDAEVTLTLEPADDGFAEFWEAYPRKEGKKPCRTAWRHVAPSARPLAIGVAQVMKQCLANGWQEAQFCPMPLTFLHQERWEDWRDGVPVNWRHPANDQQVAQNAIIAAAVAAAQAKGTDHDT